MRLAPMIALCAALASPATAWADVTVKLVFSWVDPDQAGGAVLAQPEVQATDVLGKAALTVAPGAAPAEGTVETDVTLPDSAFQGPYARIRLAVSRLALPPGDSKSDQPVQMAFELVLRREALADTVVLQVPVVTSSRRAALKPYMEMPPIVEELPARFFLAQQWMALYAASPEAVAEAPESFALHRLISRAIADFAIAMADLPPGPVLVVPPTELGKVLELYWDGQPKGRAIHLAAFADARTILWTDLRHAEDYLKQARRAGVDAVSLCNKARAVIDFFSAYPPDEEEAQRVDQMFPNPGTLSGYLQGRRLDIEFACTRLRI